MATVTKPKVRSAFGDMLREALDDNGISLKGLARLLAGDAATEEQINGQRRLLQKYLKGDVAPGALVRRRVAELLELPTDHFDEDAERRTEMQEIADALLPLVDVLHRLAVKAKERAA